MSILRVSRATRAPRSLALTLMSVLLAAACSGGEPSAPIDGGDKGGGNGGGGGAGAGSGIDELHQVPFTPNPLRVSYGGDAARSVSDKISAEQGGTLQATGADGATYTLVIPAKALAHDAAIRMTPISTITGFPLSGGMKAGVHLEPSGLRLFAAATLIIKPAATPDAKNTSGFGFHGEGDDFHLAPIAPKDGAVALTLFHFSGAGVGEGTPADRAAQQQRVPADFESYATQRTAEVFGRARQRALLGEDTGLTAEEVAEIQSLHEQWFEILVKPKLLAGTTSCDAAPEGISYYASWARTGQLLGMESAKTAAQNTEATSLIGQAMDNCREEYYQTCVDQHDLAQVERLLMLERTRQLLGFQDDGETMEYAYKCSTFELEIDSKIEWKGFSTVHQVGKILFVGPPLGGPPLGDPRIFNGTLEQYDAVLSTEDMDPVNCTYSAPVYAPTSQPMVRMGSHAGVVPRGAKGEPIGKADLQALRLDLWPGLFMATITETCRYPDYTDVLDREIGSDYLQGWFELHDNEYLGEEDGFFAIEFSADDLPDGALFGRRTYNRTTAEFTEATILNLRHRPDMDGRTAP